MGIISINNADHLYWLGRYTERVYTTIQLFSDSYDSMIDHCLNDYEDFCKRLEIPNIYTSRDDFITRYCFDETDPNSIYSNLLRAYDNCITLREEVGSETLAYIQLALYEMQRARGSQAPLIELQHVTDNILAFWGIADDLIECENVRNIIKVGKRIERLDLYSRLHMPADKMLREVHRLQGRLPRTCLRYNESMLYDMEPLVKCGEIDYHRVLEQVDTLLGA